jgi:hypothetical protein
LEVRQLLTGRAWLGLAVILSLLVGSTFAQAVLIFSEGSRAAFTSPDLVQGLNPFDGILVPTFGASYLAATLLLPFVAIRQIGQDRGSGALKLLLGLGCPPWRIIARKFGVLALSWALCLTVPLGAGWLWVHAGGHVWGAQLAGLVFGHLLFGWIVIALALLAGSLGRSGATASLLVLAATLGSWALDFEATGGGWLARLAPLSLTQALRPFERGLLPLGHLILWPLLLLVILGLAAAWVHPGAPLARKVLATLAGILAATGLFLGTARLHRSWDLTEDRRHGFPAPVAKALEQIPDWVEIEVHLNGEDPRWTDLDRGLLRKLGRALPRLRVTRTAEPGLFGRASQGGDDHYGEVLYRYQGRQDLSRSTSAEEILPLLWALTRTPVPPMAPEVPYPGYPRVLDPAPDLLWFRVLLPLLFLAIWIGQRIYRPKPF